VPRFAVRHEESFLSKLSSANSDETVLVHRAIRRDGEAFAILVDRYEAALLAVLRPYARDAERARDLVQDAYLKSVRRAAGNPATAPAGGRA